MVGLRDARNGESARTLIARLDRLPVWPYPRERTESVTFFSVGSLLSATSTSATGGAAAVFVTFSVGGLSRSRPQAS